MGLFSRDKEALEPARSEDAPFEPLRRPSRNTRKPRPALDGNPDAPPPLDPAETAKTRARRRLIGAVALALAAVVFVPMLFDRTPVPPPDDIALTIPDRDTPFEGRRGVPDPARGPLKASSDAPGAPLSTTAPTAPAALPSGAAIDDTPAAESKAVAKAPDHPPAKAASDAARPSTEPAKVADSPRAAEPAKPAAEATKSEADAAKTPPRTGDDPKALAALEGKSASATPAMTEAGAKTFAVQIAAFSTADRARGLRDQLVANGLRSYTESVSTSQGLRTRVRLGPFASREAADHARQKLRTMKLDGSVVPL